MSSLAQAQQMTDADILKYQSDLVRTKNYQPLGRMLQIAVGPSGYWDPAKHVGDPILVKFGRFIEFRNQPMPLGMCAGQILVCSDVRRQADGRPGFPDLPDPSWKPELWTEDEVTGRVARDPAKNRAPLIPQRMTDRCEQWKGEPAVMDGTDFLIFQPVERITFQPEKDGELQAEVYQLVLSPLEGRHCSFLVDHKTGKCHFLGGSFEVQGAPGK